MTTGGPDAPPKLTRERLVVGNAERTFGYYAPAARPGPMPLVIALHGRLGDGAGQDKLGHWSTVAREQGFFVALPDGVSRSWNDARGGTPASEQGVDDVAFVSALIDWFAAHFSLDSHRVYIAGMSNGGFMTATLACKLADRVAGVALVASTMPKALETTCAPSRPVAFAVIAGEADPLVPYGGGRVRRGSGGEILSANATAELWAKLDGCAAAPETRAMPDLDANDETTTDVATYAACGGGAEVRLYTVHGGGHTWPGGWAYFPEALIGKTAGDFDATEEIWRFFSAHASP